MKNLWCKIWVWTISKSAFFVCMVGLLNAKQVYFCPLLIFFKTPLNLLTYSALLKQLEEDLWDM